MRGNADNSTKIQTSRTTWGLACLNNTAVVVPDESREQTKEASVRE
jgi:hypothetical protein